MNTFNLHWGVENLMKPKKIRPNQKLKLKTDLMCQQKITIINQPEGFWLQLCSIGSTLATFMIIKKTKEWWRE